MATATVHPRYDTQRLADLLDARAIARLGAELSHLLVGPRSIWRRTTPPAPRPTDDFDYL